jgi:hypothetical protein
LSGRRPSTTGIYDNDTDWRPAIPRDQTLVTYFRANGYYTADVGKIYHERFERREEWDDYGSERPSTCNLLNPTDGVGGIKFSPVGCADDAIADYSIASYAIEHAVAAELTLILFSRPGREGHMLLRTSARGGDE